MLNWWEQVKNGWKLVKGKNSWEIIKLILYWVFGLGILIWFVIALISKK